MADKAILFGINAYQSISNLRGCENDVKDMRQLLIESFKFQDSHIKTYTNDEVVKDAIEEGFAWLKSGSSAGDRLVFHFSGHGSYTESKSNDKDVDELLCLYDMDWNDEGSFLRDTDLGRLTRTIDTGARLTVVLDSCHSGTGTRGISSTMKALARTTSRSGLIIIEDTAQQMARTRGLAKDHAEGIRSGSPGTMRMFSRETARPVYARFVEPPASVQQAIQRKPHVRVRTLGESLRTTLNHQLLAAAGEKQTAADAFIDGDYHGAFSYYLCASARTHATSTVEEVFRATKARIKSEGYGQDPQLDGPFAVERLFGGKAPMAAPDPKPLVNQDIDHSVESGQPCSACDEWPVSSVSTIGGELSNVERPDALATLSQLLRVSEKLIDLARQPQGASVMAAPSRARGTSDEVVVYVHGISEHLPGYSQAWHGAVAPHLAHTIRRAEVRWSQLVNDRSIGDSSGADKAKSLTVKRQIDDELKRRMQQIQESASQRSRGVTGKDLDAREVESRSLAVDDFSRYMMFEATREAILHEFLKVVVPELEAGRKVHVISHSWGTVVAYEGLRRLDHRTLAGRVSNLFLAGSALSIRMVQSNLLGRVTNGRAPVHVSRIINLDAGGDPVGGPIGDVFTVDQEFLGLDPVGCTKYPFTRIAVSPFCAHRSYFLPSNLAVNRDIFAAMINLA